MFKRSTKSLLQEMKSPGRTQKKRSPKKKEQKKKHTKIKKKKNPNRKIPPKKKTTAGFLRLFWSG